MNILYQSQKPKKKLQAYANQMLAMIEGGLMLTDREAEIFLAGKMAQQKIAEGKKAKKK